MKTYTSFSSRVFSFFLKNIFLGAAFLLFMQNTFASDIPDMIIDIDGVDRNVSTVTESSFSDVSLSHPNLNAINFVQSQGIVGGYPDGTFKSENPINRAEFTKIVLLARYSQEEIDNYGNQIKSSAHFSDIKDYHWFKNYVNFAQKEGIISGYSDGTFGYSQNINFAEASKIVVNVLIEPTNSANTSTWWSPFTEKLQIRNVPQYSPNKDISRGEMAEIIYMILQ